MKWLLVITCLGCEPPRNEAIVLPHITFATKDICERMGTVLIADFEQTYEEELHERNMKLSFRCEPVAARRGGGAEARR
jgi:hypothetical protein